MQKEITYEMYRVFGGGLSAWICDIECRVTIEPDEEAGDAAYYISAVEIWGKPRNAPFSYIALREGDPLRAKISEYAYKYHHDDLEELWAEYLADRPKRRPLIDIQEHGTLRAGAL